MRIGSVNKVGIVTLLVAMVSGAAMAQGNSLRVLTGSYGPKGDVRVAPSRLSWEIWPSSQPVKVSKVEFMINGQSAAGFYDEASRAAVHVPSRPLGQGTYGVRVFVTFDGGYRFTKDWVTNVSTTVTTSFPAASSSQLEAVRVANEYRAKLGLPAFSRDERLSFVAQKHSEYLTRHNLVGHDQRPGTEGYFGATLDERLAAYGWTGSSWEGVTFGTQTVRSSIAELFDAPYHRLPFLQPGQVAFGAGYAGSRMTVNFGSSRESGTVVSPGNGQIGVPTRWTNNETPNPLRMHAGSQRETGYPIVLSRFDSGVRRITITSATLTTASGAAVPAFLNTPANDEHLSTAAILIPQRPLAASTTYRVRFVGRDDAGRPIDVNSTFTTG